MFYILFIFCNKGSGSSSTIQLRVVAFYLETGPNTDYVKVYDGPDSTYKLIGTYYGLNPPPYLIESSSNWLNVVFHSDYLKEYRGFNFTYQIKGNLWPLTLTLKLLNFLNGIIHLQFLELPLSFLGISRWELKIG